jgi:hypothetical protein
MDELALPNERNLPPEEDLLQGNRRRAKYPRRVCNLRVGLSCKMLV